MLNSHHIFFTCVWHPWLQAASYSLSPITFVYSPFSDSEHNSGSSNHLVIHLLKVIVLVLRVATITVRFIWGFNEWILGHWGMHWAYRPLLFINYLLLYSNKVYTSLLLKYFPGQLINFKWHLQMPHQLITGCVLNNMHCRCTIRFWMSLTYSYVSIDKQKENIGNYWKLNVNDIKYNCVFER